MTSVEARRRALEHASQPETAGWLADVVESVCGFLSDSDLLDIVVFFSSFC